MDDEKAAPVDPPSPCVRNCCLDTDDVCLGCHRTIREICDWHKASAAEKAEVLERCRARSKARHEQIQRRRTQGK